MVRVRIEARARNVVRVPSEGPVLKALRAKAREIEKAIANVADRAEIARVEIEVRGRAAIGDMIVVRVLAVVGRGSMGLRWTSNWRS